MKMKFISRFPLFFSPFFLLAASGQGTAQEGVFDRQTGAALTDDAGQYDWVATFFTDEAPLEIELTADFRNLLDQKKEEEGEYQPGVLRVMLDEAREARINIRLKPRGYSRRKACAFPPLRIDFSHKGTNLKQVKPLQELKMVCHCREGEVFGRYLLREYLAYRLYNLLTPYSFRVRLARVQYVEQSSGAVFHSGPAFFIEEIDQLAGRLEVVVVDDERLAPDLTDREQMAMVSVFQFMIANLDWSVTRQHNIKLIQAPGRPDPLPVPYDFDFSGLVNAFYAELDPDGPQPPDLPPGRIFQGHCRTPAEFEGIFQHFRNQREASLALIRTFPYLPEDEKAGIIRFLEPFYQIIDSPQQVKSYFLTNCR